MVPQCFALHGNHYIRIIGRVVRYLKKNPQDYLRASEEYCKKLDDACSAVWFWHFLISVTHQSYVILITCRSGGSCPCWGSARWSARLQRSMGWVLQATGSILCPDKSTGNASTSSSTTGIKFWVFFWPDSVSVVRDIFFACLLLCYLWSMHFFSSKITIRIINTWLCLPDNLVMFGDTVGFFLKKKRKAFSSQGFENHARSHHHLH